jgi:8-oxo-dGTP pyrophosphatase MutT (NUDIX family)
MKFGTLDKMKLRKPDKKAAVAKPQQLLRDLAMTPDKLFSGAFRKQYGALCFRLGEGGRIEILVITSRDSGRWVLPKGWPMKGKKPHEAATIEAWEEAGVRGKARKRSIGCYTYLKELDSETVVPCIVEMFQIEVEELEAKFKERGQRAQAWVSPDEAARRVREIELKSLLVNFRPR